MIPLSAALCHNRDLDIAGLAYYLLHDRLPELFPPRTRPAAAHEYLRDAVCAGEFCDGARHILTFYYVCLDTQVTSEVHMAFDCVPHLR